MTTTTNEAVKSRQNPTVRTINTSFLSWSEKCYLVGPYLRCFEKVYCPDADGPNAYVTCGCNGWKNPAVVPPRKTTDGPAPQPHDGNLCSACKHKLIAHGNLLNMPPDEAESKVAVVLEIIEHYQEIKNDPNLPSQQHQYHIMKIKELRERLQQSVATPTSSSFTPKQIVEEPSISSIFRHIQELRYPNRISDPIHQKKDKILQVAVSAINQITLIEPQKWLESHPNDAKYTENYHRWRKLYKSARTSSSVTPPSMAELFGKSLLRSLLPMIEEYFSDSNKITLPEQYSMFIKAVFDDIKKEVYDDNSIVLFPEFKMLLPQYQQLIADGKLSSQTLASLVEPHRKGPAPRGESKVVSMDLEDDSGGKADDSKTSVEAAAAAVGAKLVPHRGSKPLEEEKQGNLQCMCVHNDGSAFFNKWMALLKTHFSKALPKMPKDYILRLCFDRKHRHLVLYADEDKIMAAVCYRPFYEHQFAEVAFLATGLGDQDKGYGRHLMNHLKEYLKPDNIFDVLAYADNYAVPFFEKQGFRKGVYMPMDRWKGLIKDYKDSTLMHSHIHPSINYLKISYLTAVQRQAVEQRIQMISPNHRMTYKGLEFANGNWPVSSPIKDIPGLADTAYVCTRNDEAFELMHTQMLNVLDLAKKHKCSWPFLQPVSPAEVPDYHLIISDPICINEIEQRLLTKKFYIAREIFISDWKRMFDNARRYNDPKTIYYQSAEQLHEFLQPYILMV